jgi:lipoyl(octanoyl) transferase
MIFDVSGRSDRQGFLLVCEHPPLISLGRDASRLHVPLTDEELASRELALRWTSRGGDAVFHAPGQLAIYPLLPLDRIGIGIVEFRRRLETAIIAVCHELRLAAKRRDEPGVWTRYGQVAAIGAGVRSWVSHHGAFFNVTIDPGLLKLIAHPSGQSQTTLQALRLRPVSMNQVREAVVRHVARAFDYESVHTYVGHPLLRRTRQRVFSNA